MTDVFLAGEALAARRLTRHELGRWYAPVFRGVYAPRGAPLTLRDRARAAYLAAGRRGAIAGVAAAALHHAAWVDPTYPVDLVGVRCRPQPGLRSRLERIGDDEVTHVAGLPVTTGARTAFDLGRHFDRYDAVARLDALIRARPFHVEDVLALVGRYPGARGSRRLVELLPIVDAGAASPAESRVRLALLDAGFPKPRTQVPVIRGHRTVAFLDVGWDAYQVAVEYDGDHHRTNRRQYVADISRARMLDELGWVVIRVIAEDAPARWLDRVRAALLARGCPASAFGGGVRRVTRYAEESRDTTRTARDSRRTA